MDNIRSSSGRFSQDSRQRPSSKKFRIRRANYSVIQRISKTGSSSCQCSTTVNGKQEEMKNYAKIIRKVLQNTLDIFVAVIGTSWDLDQRKKMLDGTYDGMPSGYWTQTAEKMLLNFEKSGHPVFRCTCALERGHLRSKEVRKDNFSFHSV